MTLINDFMSLIYPRHCEACANGLFKHEIYICNHCKLNLPKSNYHKNEVNELSQTFAGRVPLSNGLCFYLFEKSGKVQKLLHAIKYQDQKELARFIGDLYAQELVKTTINDDVDVIIPIPLHKKKLKQRGYNQSEWFAKGLANVLEKPLDIHSLERVHETSTQTKKKKYQRWENVEGIFKIKDQNALVNKHALLVDDVITTGATIEAAWLALKDIEGIKISVASIAFAARKL
ncbi:MAG: ComF family protein [Bacteroidia bacterium]|nr:ComF family protein [Bacteroidia bacterium]